MSASLDDKTNSLKTVSDKNSKLSMEKKDTLLEAGSLKTISDNISNDLHTKPKEEKPSAKEEVKKALLNSSRCSSMMDGTQSMKSSLPDSERDQPLLRKMTTKTLANMGFEKLKK